MTEDAGGCIFGRELEKGGDGGDENEVGGESVARAVSSLAADDVDGPIV